MKRLLVTVAFVSLLCPVAFGGTMWRVVEIVDGNTLVVEQDQKRMTVGLIAVVTPDPKDTKHDLKTYADGAKQFLTAFVNNQWLYLEKDSTYKAPKKDSPAQVYAWRTDGAFVNERVISEGFGVAYTKNPFQYRGSFSEQQRVAMAGNRGLWGDDDPSVAIRRGSGTKSRQFTYLGEGPSWETPQYRSGSTSKSAGRGSVGSYAPQSNQSYQASERVAVWLFAVYGD